MPNKYLLIAGNILSTVIYSILIAYAWRQAYLAAEWKRLYHTSNDQIQAIAKWKHDSHKEKQNEIRIKTNP